MVNKSFPDESDIVSILKSTFQISYLKVIDNSHLHARHAEARQSKGKHFSVLIVATDFDNKRPLDRHRMVYQALKDDLGSVIHALAVKAYTPGEYKGR